MITKEKFIERLETFKRYEDDWDDQGSLSFNSNAIDRFLNLFNNFYDHSLPLPYPFPGFFGDLWLDWWIKEYHITIETDLLTADGYMYVYSKDEKIETTPLCFKEKESWEIVLNLVRKLINANQ